MKLRLIAALKRRRLRRRIALERAQLAEMETTARELLGAQAHRVARLEALAPNSFAIARQIEQRAKAALFA